MASSGLLAVAEMLGMIGKAAKLAASDLREANEIASAAPAESASGSSMPRAAGTGSTTPGMGSAPSDAVTTNGLAAALQITRGRSL